MLLAAGRLQVWHLYCLNALNGLMNTIQKPAADVTITLVTPEKHFQKACGMRNFSDSLVNILTPVFANTLLALLGCPVERKMKSPCFGQPGRGYFGLRTTGGFWI